MKEIYLTQGKITFVDDEDYELLNRFKWCYWTSKEINYGYAIRTIDTCKGRKTIKIHRTILDASQEFEVDHIDRNGLNNQKSNLRLVTDSQQKQNQIKYKNCSSKYKGIFLDTERNKWRAEIRVNKLLIDLGRYSNEIAAAEMYDLAARMYFGEFGRYNFPKEGERSALVEEQEIKC